MTAIDYGLNVAPNGIVQDCFVEKSSGDVVLSGTVDSRRDKRRAEDIAESVSGVKNVENRIRVSDYQRSGWGSTTSEQGYTTGSNGEDRARTVGGTT
jgi:Flp pilus assembly secretin CpaC